MAEDATTAMTTINTSNIENGTDGSDATVPADCKPLMFQGFIPWDNPDNIVSQDVEQIVKRLEDAIVLPILFLFGGPNNVINMAVFFKQGLRERINVCLFARSLVDLLFLLHCMVLNGEFYNKFSTNMGPSPMYKVYSNANMTGLYGLPTVSQLITAIIASERCFCVLRPLTSQTLATARTTAVALLVVFVVFVGGYFVVGTKHRVVCMYNPVTLVTFDMIGAGTPFYRQHREMIDYCDFVVYGLVMPVASMVVVATTTAVTGFKLRQAANWRAESSSAAALSTRQVALTKMLIGTSVLFIVCVTPIFILKFTMLFDPEMKAGRRQHNFVLLMYWLSEMSYQVISSGNFVIYYVMGSRYRQTLHAMLRSACGCCVCAKTSEMKSAVTSINAEMKSVVTSAGVSDAL